MQSFSQTSKRLTLQTIVVVRGKDLTLRKQCAWWFLYVSSHAQLQTLILIVSHCFLFLDLIEGQVTWIRPNYKLACRKYNSVSDYDGCLLTVGTLTKPTSNVHAISKTPYWNLYPPVETSTESWMGGLNKEQRGGEQGPKWAWWQTSRSQ